MPWGVSLDHHERYMNSIPLILHVMRETLFPVNHKADSRSRAQQRHGAENQEAHRSPTQDLHLMDARGNNKLLHTGSCRDKFQ
ncbi:Os08g0533101, partial [Oryza sativa Japonica Group]